MRYGLALAFLCVAAVASAQPTTSYRLAIYLQGGAAPITTFDFNAVDVRCGQVRPAPQTGTVPNPTEARWQDPANAAQDCEWDDPGTGPLFSLPFSPTVVYEASLRAINSAGVGAESARSNPFARPGAVPVAPAQLRLRTGS